MVILRTLFAPVEHINNTDPSITSMRFRVVSLLYWVAMLGGFFVFMPYMIRRHRLFNSGRTQLALVCFVLPCVLLAMCSVVLQEWMGSGFLISSSPVILIVLYYAVKIAHAIFNEPEANGVEFNEAYIIIAGFVPMWLGSTLGKALLEVINQGNVFGTLVIVMFWRVIIWIFEVMCAEIGRKATRMSDEAIFSFCAIYTGAVYAEFIFLSVEFNSTQFYLLLLLEFATIVFWQGGRIIDIQQWIVQYLPSTCYVTQKFKAGWLVVIGEMPGEVAERCSHFSGTEYPPDVALSLIRSRAVVVQITWAQNDIKMASELQSLACATFAVAADMIFSQFDIGVEFITVPSKQELFYIYLINLFVIIIAQGFAQYEIKSKVKSLKADVTKVVQALTASKKRSSNEKMKQLSGVGMQRGSGGSVTLKSGSQRLSRHESTETVDEDKEDSTNYNPLASLRENKPPQIKKRSQRRSSIIDIFESAINTVKEQVVETDDNDHFLDLQDILDITEEINDDGGSYATRGRKSTASTGRHRVSSTATDGSAKRRTSHMYSNPIFNDQDFNAFGDENSIIDGNNLCAGYLKLQRRDGMSYQRKYFILTPEVLVFYNKESDVSEHVAAIEGKVLVSDIRRILQDVSTPLKFSLVLDKVTYHFEAFTDTEADTWFSQLSAIVSSNPLLNTDTTADSTAADYNFIDRKRQNITAYRRSSVGGIPSVVNSLLYPSRSKLPLKSGYLEKHNNLFWQKRYFMLKQPGVLCWYGSEKDARSDTEMKNSLSMDRVLSVSQSDEDSCCFEIDIRGRTFYLKALSTGLASEWCDCITAWSKFMFIQNGNKRGSSRKDSVVSAESKDLNSLRDRTDTAVSGLTENSCTDNQIEMSLVNSASSERKNPVKRNSLLSLGSAETMSPDKKKGIVMIKAPLFATSKWKTCEARIVNPGVLTITNVGLPNNVIESINMWEVLSVDVSEDEDDFEYCLDLVLKGSVFVLKLSTPSDRDAWIDCLSTWANTEKLDLGVDVVLGDEEVSHVHEDDDVVSGSKKRRSSFFDLTMDKLRQHNIVLRGEDSYGNYNRLDSVTSKNTSQFNDDSEVVQKVPFGSSPTDVDVDMESGLLVLDSRDQLAITSGDDKIKSSTKVNSTDNQSIFTATSVGSGLSRFFKRLSVGNEEDAAAVVGRSSGGDDNAGSDNDDEYSDKVGELISQSTRMKSGSVFQNEDHFVAKVCERSMIRRNTQLPSAWAGGAATGTDKGKQRRRMSIDKAANRKSYHHIDSASTIPDRGGDNDTYYDTRSRTESTCADQTFIERNTTTDQDDFVNKLKTRSYHELNREFWHRHRWYLTAVVCYVTMHVLSVTSYMISETSFEKE
eukprot:CAMPEP_0114421826 /NCGR_PEP_ID=MMETSP0103-20121206/5287_1 /TAXON_ID=37642 ORGANISM="Paraphysomonas imperforata, Strain PA2" /NCGR_SAMPLE_ID=MMETSP0103 /ASSEMBLY_ACC=CAM_ASM_000201 /LENGTH=1351 /DNA_ID=CAMNT_0001590377 /DNA_START=358 /DNA_END=4413 /DNA_ORIENTATION=-